MKTPSRKSTATLGSVLLTICFAAACREPIAEESTESRAGATVSRYELRGQLLTASNGVLQIFHEPIHNYADDTGTVVGMDSMMMTWPLADGVEVEGLDATDIIAFTLEVDWSAVPAARIVEIEELPAETELAYGPAQLPGSPSAGSD